MSRLKKIRIIDMKPITGIKICTTTSGTAVISLLICSYFQDGDDRWHLVCSSCLFIGATWAFILGAYFVRKAMT